MRRIIGSALVIFSLFEGISFLGAATYQPLSLGYVTLSISSGTAADIMNSTAPTVGYLRYCTNCGAAGGAGTICVSTGSANYGQFVISTGTRCQ